MFRYKRDGEVVLWHDLFEDLDCATQRDWRLSDEIGIAEREAHQRKFGYTFRFEEVRYEVEWYEYLPECLQKLGYIRYTWCGAGWFGYYGDGKEPLYISIHGEWFKYGSADTRQLSIPKSLCVAVIEFFDGSEV